MPLSHTSFEYVRAVLRERCGHQLEDDKAYLVDTRLSPVARRHGLPSAEELLARMRARRNERLLAEVVEAMTIKETFFFRDGRPFDVLRQVVFPELIRRRAGVRRLNIWSAACSSGQEPYSVAMLLGEHFPVLENWAVRLIASDLSPAMLERARHGRYSRLELSRGLPPDMLEKYFRARADGWHVKDDLRRRVEFFVINLNSAWPELPLLDLVLLRNVLIYFDGPTREKILGRVERVLAPDGYLLLGGAETTIHLDTNWEPITFEQTSLFRLKGRPVG